MITEKHKTETKEQTAQKQERKNSPVFCSSLL